MHPTLTIPKTEEALATATVHAIPCCLDYCLFLSLKKNISSVLFCDCCSVQS